jgi:hypothetical protein
MNKIRTGILDVWLGREGQTNGWTDAAHFNIPLPVELVGDNKQAMMI